MHSTLSCHSLTPNVVGQYKRTNVCGSDIEKYNKVIQHGVACQPTSVEATKCTGNQHSDKRKQQGIDSTNRNKQEVATLMHANHVDMDKH